MEAWLNGLMNSGSAASTDYELYANWMPTGVWQGLFSGGYDGGLFNQGDGYYWSSTAGGTVNAYFLSFGDGGVNPGYNINKIVAYAVRCAI